MAEPPLRLSLGVLVPSSDQEQQEALEVPAVTDGTGRSSVAVIRSEAMLYAQAADNK